MASTNPPMIIKTDEAIEVVRVDSSGKIGVNTPTPTHPLHVNSNTGIRQNSLYLSGGNGWSSLSYNAHHNDANSQWVFPEPSHAAVTIEMDDHGGLPRLEVFSTTTAAPTTWTQRLAVDGNSGNVLMGQSGGNVGIGTTAPVSRLQVGGDLTLEKLTPGSPRSLPASTTMIWNDGTWLRLNQNLDGSKPIFGVQTPGVFASGSLNIGGANGWGDPGYGNAWFRGSVRIDSGHVTTNSPNGALVLNAGPADTTNVAGIWFRKTTVLGDIRAYTDLMRITVDGQAWLKGSLHIDTGHVITNSPNGALVLDAGPPDATNVAGIWFRKTTVLGDPRAYTDLMRVTAAGNVGIGTAIPQAGLEINKGATNDLALLVSSSGPGWGSGIQFKNTASGGKTYGIYSGWGHLHFADVDQSVDRIVITNEGNVRVTADLIVQGHIISQNADCAEEFEVGDVAQIEPGTVMVLTDEGGLQPGQQAYDKRVAGVISGAGNYKPGLILDKQPSSDNRVSVALVGKVYCKVDAQYAPIDVGDLLTTSPTPGYAMKANDPLKAFGSVIGKALRPLRAGQSLIPILIALQ